MYLSFVSSIKNYGRVHEFGMMLKFYLSIIPDLLAKPLATIRMPPLGLKLFTQMLLDENHEDSVKLP